MNTTLSRGIFHHDDRPIIMEDEVYVIIAAVSVACTAAWVILKVLKSRKASQLRRYDDKRVLVGYIKENLDTGVGACGAHQQALDNGPIYSVSNTTVNQKGSQLITCLTHWRKSQLYIYEPHVCTMSILARSRQ